MRETPADGRCLKGGPRALARAARLYVRGMPGIAILTGIVLSGLSLSGCSLGSDSNFTLFADPGKYQYYSCDQIAAEMKSWANREKELKSLMDRADESAGGTAVGLIAYKADYVAAGEELDLLKATAHNKNCDQAPSWRSDAVIH
jgi:hypothetical protein